MAAIALYAALLDGNVSAVLLRDPPATQNAASSPDGRGEAIEMLNCLRITDIPQAAGLLYPANLVMAGPTPASFDWPGELYRTLGAAEKFQRLERFSEWKSRP